MRRLSLIRVAVLIVMRDIVIPSAGVYIAVTRWETLGPHHLPLIAAMLGTPFIARGSESEK